MSLATQSFTISHRVAEQMEGSSWIRRMFEAGIQLRRERGAENVFDFSLGNPEVEPPAAVLDALRQVTSEARPHSHGYMPNAGFPEVRASIARHLAERTGLPFHFEDIFMTNGAAGALNIFLKAVIDPGDEVIVLRPHFPEYRFYIENQGGRVIYVDTGADFLPDFEAIERAITPRTKALILNTPNNPSGVVYSEDVLRRLDRVIPDSMLVISDEPYRPLTFDGVTPPETCRFLRRAVVAWSWSKAMAIPGERIGYLAIPPHLPEAEQLRSAFIFAARTMGYINAPALWQLVVGRVPGATVDVAEYQEKRDILCDALRAMGYDAPRPQGSFYVFPRTPLADDVAFVRLLQNEGILAVPGIGFGRGGYVRLSLTIAKEQLVRSLPGFEKAMRAAIR